MKSMFLKPSGMHLLYCYKYKYLIECFYKGCDSTNGISSSMPSSLFSNIPSGAANNNSQPSQLPSAPSCQPLACAATSCQQMKSFSISSTEETVVAYHSVSVQGLCAPLAGHSGPIPGQLSLGQANRTHGATANNNSSLFSVS